MEVILEYFILFFSLFSLGTLPCLMLANSIPNIQHPRNFRGNESDYEALLAIKGEISNDPHSVLSSWSNNSLHFCEWEGITCGDRHKRVVSLRLSSTNSVGTLSPFIGNLSFLRLIDLSNNSFRGYIPHQVSHLPRLQTLVLGSNSFEGKIPANLSHCLNLSILDLSENNLVGEIPTDLATLPNLEVCYLDTNKFSGQLQDIGFGNMSTSLQTLFLSENHLQGSIPDDIGRLKGLLYLSLGDNMISGIIPSSLFNLSNLEVLYLTNTNIHGYLPQDLGLRLPQLRYLSICNTTLIGQVPTSLSNLSMLQSLSLSVNSFTGGFYLNGNNLRHLSFLNIDFAFSLGGEARDLNFLDTLVNCTKLETLLIGYNSFTGTFPHSILNLSTSLKVLDLGHNQISGQIPFGLGKFVNLFILGLGGNHFTGPIPADTSKLEIMEHLEFANNNFSGGVPFSLGNLTRLSSLSMEYNNLEGPLPRSLGNCKNLQSILLSNNKLSGDVPVELFRASSLIDLEMGQNNMQGSLPIEIGRLKNLILLNVSHNRFSGDIPSTLGDCTGLSSLDMSGNSFVGSIPESLSPLKSIQYLDLSCNNLSGHIPSYFSTWPYLLSLNLSFNALEGEVPANGVFANASVVSVASNNKLCGGVLELHLPRCPSPKESKKRRLSLAMIAVISIVCVLTLVVSLALCFYLLHRSRGKKDAGSELQDIKPFLEVSYQMLSRATNGFSLSNLIGVGGFGSVYKGILHKEDTELAVAVKVMNHHNKGAGKSFLSECKALRNIRHRNLVKIITACSSIDSQRNNFKALVYEFMPRGSLEGCLYSNLVDSEHVDDNQSCSLSLFERLNIAIDVACALEYLQIECTNPIIHCDLKPTNILIDEEMTAKVGDFGLTKFLSGASTSDVVNQSSSTQVRGTVGYAAPEYGLGSKASVEGDIYSFGIVVLEMMTSKKPTDPMFNEGLNLHEFAKSAFPDRVMEIIDQRILLSDAELLRGINGADIKKMECIKSLIMVGVQCSTELPHDRMNINDVVNELKSVRQNLLCRRT